MEATDLAAVERTRGGDTAAFRVLVERYGRSVFRLAFRMTGNEFDAEDVVQETFLRAFKQLDSYESRSSFGTWLYRIAANYSLDLIRSRKRHAARHVADTAEQEDVLDSVKTNDPGQDRVYYSSQVKVRLDAALQLLSDQERTAFQLRHFEGKSIEEIGAILDLGASATKNSIFRAVRKVREALEPVVSSMKQHLEDDDLILHFYGETGATAQPHLSDCAACRARYQALQRVLNVVDAPTEPYRGPEYESQVWNRLAPKLGQKRRFSWWSSRRWIPVFAAAALLVIAFFAGRYSPKPVPQVAQNVSGVREGVLLVAVGDHLERSEMLLIEIANSNPRRSMNVVEERETAQDLVYANRLYRQTAATSGDDRVVSLLDDLERVLLEVAHSPAELHGVRLENLREQIKNEGLIFKIRVAGSKLAQGEML